MRVYPNLTVDEEFASLGSSGHTGSLNDRQFKLLRALGYTGALNDMLQSFVDGVAVSSALSNTNGDFVAITFSEDLIGDGGSPALSDFEIRVDGVAATLTEYAASGTNAWTSAASILTFTLPSNSISFGESVVFEYTPGANPLKVVSTDAALGSITTPVTNLVAFGIEEDEGEPVITSSSGDLTVTIGSGTYAGTYTQRVTDSATLTVAMVEAATTPLVLPTFTGTLATGEVQTGVAGLWIYAGTDPGSQSHQWYRDGVAISGATGLTYTLVSADLGTDITLRETFDGVSIDSAAATIPGSFSLGDVSGLADNHVATANVTDTSGDVSAWGNSESGGNSFSQATGSRQPRTGDTTQNGKNVLDFDGSLDYMLDNSSPEFSASGAIFVVFQCDSVASVFDGIYSTAHASNGDFQFDTGSTADSEWHGRINSTVHTALSRSTSVGTGWVVQAYRWNAATNEADLWTNGVEDDSVTDYNTDYTTVDTINIGVNRGLSGYPPVSIGQVVRYSDAPTDTEMGDIFTHLQSEWGIS